MELTEDKSFLVGSGKNERLYEPWRQGEHPSQATDDGRLCIVKGEIISDGAKAIVEVWSDASLSVELGKFELNLHACYFGWELVREVCGRGEPIDVLMYYPDDRHDITLVFVEQHLLTYAEWEAQYMDEA